MSSSIASAQFDCEDTGCNSEKLDCYHIPEIMLQLAHHFALLFCQLHVSSAVFQRLIFNLLFRWYWMQLFKPQLGTSGLDDSVQQGREMSHTNLQHWRSLHPIGVLCSGPVAARSHFDAFPQIGRGA